MVEQGGRLDELNYHQLRLFWAVAREGHLTRASERLRLTPQTVSSQIRALEETLDERLFHRAGRRLVLTDAGRVALHYADEIFSLGTELREVLHGSPNDRPLRFVVGVVDVLPKLAVHRLLAPALTIDRPLQLVCREGPPERLLADLVVHRLDLVLLDGPARPSDSARTHHDLVARCGITFLALAGLAARLREGFPRSLDGAPALLPAGGASLRRELERWFVEVGVRPRVAGEFDDIALVMMFGEAGAGFFAVPTTVADDVVRRYGVEPIGATDDIVESYFAVSLRTRTEHPAITAIRQAARTPTSR